MLPFSRWHRAGRRPPAQPIRSPVLFAREEGNHPGAYTPPGPAEARRTPGLCQSTAEEGQHRPAIAWSFHNRMAQPRSPTPLFPPRKKCGPRREENHEMWENLRRLRRARALCSRSDEMLAAAGLVALQSPDKDQWSLCGGFSIDQALGAGRGIPADRANGGEFQYFVS